MKSLLLSKYSLAILALLAGLVLGRLFFAGPETGNGSPEHSEEDHQGGEAGSETWTCSMHPQIQQGEPGDCPICGMDLIPVESDSGSDEGAREMTMSEASRGLADIRTTPVERRYPVARIRMVGRLEFDETREKSLTARFPARIEELFVNFTGIPVKAGEHLAEVYSPELLSAQQELLTAHRSDPESPMARAAREKLRLWDLTPDQIDAIIERGEAQDRFVLRAPIGGVVVEKQVKEGSYIQTGESLFRIVDLSELWLFLDAYESDLPWLRFGQEVSFTVEAFPGETFEGTLSFIEPEVDREKRTVPVRVNVPNPDRRLKPGMFARGVVEARMGEGGNVFAPELAGKWISPMHPEVVKNEPGTCDVCGMDLVPAEELGYVEAEPEGAPLVIPSSSVLRTGRRAVVYVEKADAERPTFEGREVVLGPRAGDSFIVSSGLEEGERVVINGAFKIDSALQIQARPSMMNPEGGGAVPGHDHGAGDEMPAQEAGGGDTAEVPEIESPLAPKLIDPYLDLQSALAGDSLSEAREALQAMMELTGHEGALPDLLHAMLEADDLEGMRTPHFEDLSNALIAAVREEPEAFEGELLLMNCPMVHGDTGADWIQRSEPLLNPYFGATMLRCGDVKETLVGGTDAESAHDHE